MSLQKELDLLKARFGGTIPRPVQSLIDRELAGRKFDQDDLKKEVVKWRLIDNVNARIRARWELSR